MEISFSRSIVFFFAFAFSNTMLLAQTSTQAEMTDYLLYSGQGENGATVPGTPGYSVSALDNARINGPVGSATLYLTSDEVKTSGDVHSGGKVIINGNNSVEGNITAANNQNATNNIMNIGDGSEIFGNVDVNGDVYVSPDGGMVFGDINLPVMADYQGPAPDGTIFQNGVTLPQLPSIPQASTFSDAGTGTITESVNLEPGSHGSMSLTGNAIIRFNEPGTYTFQDIQNSGKTNVFRFEFSADTEGQFIIQVHGDAILGRVVVDMVDGGSASQILLETHGTGESSDTGDHACVIQNGTGTSGYMSNWAGSIFAPYAGIFVGYGFGTSEHIGAFWSASQVSVGFNTVLDFEPFPFLQSGPSCDTPTVTGGPNVNIPCGSTVSLNGDVSGLSVASWEALGSGNIVSQMGASAIVNQAGKYVLTGTDGDCSATDTVTVTAVPAFTVDVDQDLILSCQDQFSSIDGSDITISASLTAAVYTWVASSGFGLVSSDQNTGDASFETAGTYVLTVTAASGCEALDSLEVSFDEASAFVSVSGISSVACDTEEAQLVASSNTINSQYTWYTYTNGTIVSDGNTNTPTIMGPGTYTVSVERDGACLSTDSLEVTFDDTYLYVYAGEDMSMDCEDYSVLLNDILPSSVPTTTAPVSYSWEALDGGNIIDGQSSPSAEVDQPGTYVLSVTFDNGCIGTDTALVSFSPSPFSFDAGPDQELDCNGYGVYLYGSNDLPLYNEYWYGINGGVVEDYEGPVATTIGDYVMVVSSPNGLCIGVDTMSVTYPFSSELQPYAGPDTSFTCQDGSVNLIATELSGNGFYIEYEWSTTNGNIVNYPFQEQVEVDAPGDYIITMSGGEGNYCTYSDTVHVDALGPLPPAFAGNDTSFIAGCQVLLSANSIANAEYSWESINGAYGFTSSINPPQYTLAAAGQVVLTVSTGSYCTSSDTVNVFQNPDSWSVSADPLYDELTCEDQVLTLQGTTNYDGTNGGSQNVVVYWHTDNGNFVNGPPVLGQTTVQVDQAGTYYFILSHNFPTCQVTQAVTITDNMIAPSVDAGDPDAINCTINQIQLTPITDAQSPSYQWTAGPGGVIDMGPMNENPVVSGVGKYYVTVTDTDTGCSAIDSVEIFQGPCIIPYYQPLAEGKSFDKIGSELTSLFDNYTSTGTDTITDIFRIFSDSVYIEVITLEGSTSAAFNLLTGSPALGMTDLIPNGLNPLIITGKFPIENLPNLELAPIVQHINYVRPLFPALTSSGVVSSQGDIAQKSDYVRDGYGINGSGVKVCVLSDSYNTVIGDPALANVLNGDLPGASSPDFQTPVDIIQEYPYGQATDEGRAMLQIVHDVAPGAELGFRSGIISEGDLAMGVIDCMDNGCDVIVDDVTFLTSPFYQDGVIALAVDSVVSEGVSYFVAAGNFEDNSYEGQFNPVPAPEGFVGEAHDFGGGDILQSMTLSPGVYTFVLQWEDEIYSLGNPTTGTVNDFDIYLNNEFGTEYFGFNRDNLGGDPIEVMPFIVPEPNDVQANIMITRAAGTENAKLKFIAFRGDPDFNEFEQGTSTIVGQANSASAITLGAVDYYQTPEFGVDPPVVSLFSSEGGTAVEGGVRNKPDLLAPNGGSTTVDLGVPDQDGDGFPDFFGTSAAAPHAAGVGALLISAMDQFYSQDLSPADLKGILMTTANDFNTGGGWDFFAGAGLLQADSAMLALAAPTPQLDALLPEVGAILGTDPFEVTVQGDFFTTQSVLMVGSAAVATSFVNGQELLADISPYTGNPDIYVFTPSLTPSLNDGGYSDTLYFGQASEPEIVITADDKSKIFGEELPVFSSTITVDGVPLTSTALTLSDIGIADISYISPAEYNTNVDFYFIEPVISLSNPSFEDQYDYTMENGLLTIEKMNLLITPRDTTMVYGSKVDGREFNYDYTFDETIVPAAELSGFKDELEADHRLYMAKEVALVEDSIEINGRKVVEQDFINLAFTATQRAVVSGSAKISQRAVVSGGFTTYELDTTYVVDLSPSSIFEYQADSAEVDLFATGPLLSRERAAISQRAVVSGSAKISQRAVVSGSSLLNSSSPSANGSADIVVIFDEDDESAPLTDTIFTFHSLNLITGLHVDSHMVVSAALLSANFEISNSVGEFIITEAPLTVSPTDLSISEGQTPLFTYDAEGYKYDDSTKVIVTGTPVYQVFDSGNTLVSGPIFPVGTYTVEVSGLSLVTPTNYSLIIESGTLIVNEAILSVQADIIGTDCGDPAPPMTATISGINPNDNITVVSAGPSFSMSPVYDETASPCLPGEYVITPSGLSLSPVNNAYTIEYLPGTLYVNPKGPGAVPISIGYTCIEELSPQVNGYSYKAYVWYKNLNATTLYIPQGANNNVTAIGEYEWDYPEIFLPGEHVHEVLFDGDEFEWTVKSYGFYTLFEDHVAVDEFSSTCFEARPIEMVHAQSKELGMPYGLYPNPTEEFVTVTALTKGATIRSIVVTDMMGRIQDAPQVNDYLGEMTTLDFRSLPAGLYLVRVSGSDRDYVIQMFKE